MKVTVTKYLNVRVGAPSVNAPCYQYLAPGTQLEIDGKSYPGDAYDGNAIWYRDEANNYYWSGGVDSWIDKKVNLRFEYLQYSNTLIELGIPEVHKMGLTGKGVKIAVLDTGVNVDAFSGRIDFNLSNQFIQDPNYSSFGDILDMDQYSHGSKVSGLISAPPISGVMTAIAPDAELVILKIGVHKSNPSDKVIKSALKFCLDIPDIRIVNFSYNSLISSSNHISWYDDFENLIGSKLVIASSGNREMTLFPATLRKCIGVGRFDIESGLLKPSVNNSHLYFTYGTHLKTVNKMGLLDEGSGTSFATPIITGLTALKLQQIGISKPGYREAIFNAYEGAFNSTSQLVDSVGVMKILNLNL